MSAAAAAAPVPPVHAKGADDAIEQLGWGLAFKKHAFGKDSIDSRDVFYRKAEASLHWGPTGKRSVDSSRTIKIVDVTEVAWGKQTAAFEKKSSAKADEKRCVSVTTKKRSLDLEFDSDEQAIMLVTALLALCRKAGIKVAYKSKLVAPAQPAAASAAGGKSDSKSVVERVDTTESPANALALNAALSPTAADGKSAVSPVGSPIAATTPAVASDPDDELRTKFFSEVNAAGKTGGIEYFVLVKPANDAKCYHSTSKAIGPREFSHLGAAVTASTTLLNLTETAPLATDVATKQRLAECKSEIEAVKKELAATMDAIHQLEAADPAAAAAAPAATATAADVKAPTA